MDMILVMNPQNSILSEDGSIFMGEKSEILRVRLKDYLSGFEGKKVFFREKHAMSDTFFASDTTHSIANTKDFDIHKDLKPFADYFYDKTRYNAFFKTGLEGFLKRQKVSRVFLAGAETHTSVLFTAEGLRNLGYDTFLVEPCTMARDSHMHAYAISLMRNFLGVQIGC